MSDDYSIEQAKIDIARLQGDLNAYKRIVKALPFMLDIRADHKVLGRGNYLVYFPYGPIGELPTLDDELVNKRYVDGQSVIEWDNIILLDGDGTASTEYDADSAGLDSAIAAAASGDVIWIPACTISGNHTIPAGVKVAGVSRKGSILTGQITLSDGASIENLTIDRNESSASDVYGVTDSGNITAYIINCTIDVQNSGAGGAYAVYLGLSGDFYVWDSDLLAEVGTDGYAGYVFDGNLYQYGGRAKGTTSLTPYYY